MRKESDSMGTVLVDDDRYWGAQTERAIEHFPGAGMTFSMEFIHAYALVKKACALSNAETGDMEEKIANAVMQACDEVISGRFDNEFPLSIWQSGSGTQTNMNLNEVIANRANEILGGEKGTKKPVHPNDHVNRSQSTNDSFPTAMHVSAVTAVKSRLLPALSDMQKELENKSRDFEAIIKVGRTHLQDATPLTLGQEFSGYAAQIEKSRLAIARAVEELYEIPIGGTAVGTGLNTKPDFAARAASYIALWSELPFTAATNKFSLLAAHDGFVRLSGEMSALAASFTKIANDIRWLGSGPRCGIGELKLPANEPGSSIMPGKVNPTQSEALTMIAAQVMGNHTTVSMAGSSGNFELNVFKPVIIYNVLQSIRLLSEGSEKFTRYALKGLSANRHKIESYLEQSLMLVTALNPYIGYDNAARIAKTAFDQNISLKEAANKLGILNEEEFDSKVRPENMIGPQN